MRVDGERAAEETHRFSDFRPAGSHAEREAIGRLATSLESAGWEVEHQAATTFAEPDDSPVAFGIAAATAGLILELGDVMGLGQPGMYVLAATFLGLVLVARIDHRWRTGSWLTPRFVSPGLRALRPERSATRPRVVLLSHPDTRPPDVSFRMRSLWTALDTAWLILLWAPSLRYGVWPWLDQAGPVLLSGLGLLALLRTLDPWQHRPWPYPGDNRTGLALLGEIAREWPRSTTSRLDLEIRVLGHREPAQWRAIEREWGDRPTLVLNLDAPGTGAEIFVVGSGEAIRLADEAARDLWLPYRRLRFAPGPLDHEFLVNTPGLSITSARGAEPIEPGLLAASGLLVYEIALRWAGRIRAGADETGREGSPPRPVS